MSMVLTTFLLDTGSDWTIIPKSYWTNTRTKPRFAGKPKKFMGVGGHGMAAPVKNASIMLRPKDSAPVRIPPSTVWLEQTDDLSYALLGADLFKHLKAKISFDYNDHTAMVEWDD